MQTDDGFFVLVLGVLAAVLTTVLWWHLGAIGERRAAFPATPATATPTPAVTPTPTPPTPTPTPTATAAPIPTAIPATTQPTATPPPATPTPTAEPASLSELVAALDQIVTESPIEFAVGSSQLTDGSRVTLDRIVELLVASTARVVVVGHTDDRGDPLQNEQLSLERARAVVNHLVANGIDERRLSAEGRGGAEPIADNDTEAGRAANRRIELLIGDDRD